jgi:uncharacterized protein YegJ (DUF2314 family)
MLDAQQVGEYVKLCFEEDCIPGERMWVQITERAGDDFKGVLHNQPFELKTVQHGDAVIFEARHIYQIE